MRVCFLALSVWPAKLNCLQKDEEPCCDIALDNVNQRAIVA
jgi:hypothetical protein